MEERVRMWGHRLLFMGDSVGRRPRLVWHLFAGPTLFPYDGSNDPPGVFRWAIGRDVVLGLCKKHTSGLSSPSRTADVC